MYCYVDESGNTGLELFDRNQPTLFYGLLGARTNLDVIAEPVLKELRRVLDVKRIHANELRVARLTRIADRLIRFSKKNDLRLSLLRIEKPDHAIISFFDQVFDSGMNQAVSWHHYFTPLRYVLLAKVAYLFDAKLAKAAWKARREVNTSRCAELLKKLCNDLLERADILPDARSRELIGGALRWAAANPHDISYGVGNYDAAIQISPNLVGFQQVLQTIALLSSGRNEKVVKIVVDRQTKFNGAQGELADIYGRMKGIKVEYGPGMPAFDYSLMPEVPPIFTPGDASAGLELVDITLWIAKRFLEGKSLSDELRALFWAQARRGVTDSVSLASIEKRWSHLLDLPDPDQPLPSDLKRRFDELEESRRKAVKSLDD